MSSLVLEGCALPADAASRYFIFATPLASHPIWLQAKAGFEDACKELGVEGDWLGPNIIDVEAMEKVVETGILQKADGMITQGVLSSELLQNAKRKGLPVVLVDSDMKPEDRLCFLGKDFHEQARLFLNDIEEHLGKNEPLTIAIQAANLAFDIAQEQIQEIRDVFAAHPGGYEIVSLSQSLSDEVRSRKEWESVLAEHPDINVAINFAGESGCCCYDAVHARAMEEDLLIYGVDDIEQTLRYVEEGKITGTVVTSFYQYGYQSMMILDTYLKEKKANSLYSVSLEMLTKEKMDTAKASMPSLSPGRPVSRTEAEKAEIEKEEMEQAKAGQAEMEQADKKPDEKKNPENLEEQRLSAWNHPDSSKRFEASANAEPEAGVSFASFLWISPDSAGNSSFLDMNVSRKDIRLSKSSSFAKTERGQ